MLFRGPEGYLKATEGAAIKSLTKVYGLDNFWKYGTLSRGFEHLAEDLKVQIFGEDLFYSTYHGFKKGCCDWRP